VSHGLRLDDGCQAILFCSEPLAASHDADMLRGTGSLQHTPVRVLLCRLDTTDAVLRNPAAVQAFGPVARAGMRWMPAPRVVRSTAMRCCWSTPATSAT